MFCTPKRAEARCERAEDEAINVFARKHDLLMAPAGMRHHGPRSGLRTGEVAVVDATGKLVATDTVFTHRASGQSRRHRRGTVYQT